MTVTAAHVLAVALSVASPVAARGAVADEVFEYDRDHPAAGFWVGTISGGALPAYAIVSVDRDDAGQWSARATTVLLLAFDKNCNQVVVDGHSLAFTLESDQAHLVFEGRVSDDGQVFSGTTMSRRGAKGTFEFGRTIRVSETAAPITLTGQVRLPTSQAIEISLVLGQTPGGNWLGEITIPAQGVKGFPLRDVLREGDTVTAVLPGPPDASIEGTFADGETTFKGHMKQSGFAMPLELSTEGGAAMAGPRRPQHPKHPLPYQVRELRIEHPDGYTLAGTLTIPTSAGPHPAAVLISGSGQQDRDESVFGHKPFLVIADYLTRRGIAVARYDDRGVGESTGVDTLADATTQGFASDAAEVVRALRSAQGIDRDRIGLIGHSEGGIIAPMVANADPRIAYVVLLAATAVTGEEVMVLQNRLAYAALGTPEELLDEMERLHRSLFEAITKEAGREEVRRAIIALSEAQLKAQGMAPPKGAEFDAAVEGQLRGSQSAWMRFFATYDPAPALARLRCPVLALNGTLDLQVWHEQNLTVIEQAITQAGGDVTAVRYEGLNHMFQPATTGHVAEYGQIETTFDEQVLEEMVGWIKKKVQEGRH